MGGGVLFGRNDCSFFYRLIFIRLPSFACGAIAIAG